MKFCFAHRSAILWWYVIPPECFINHLLSHTTVRKTSPLSHNCKETELKIAKTREPSSKIFNFLSLRPGKQRGTNYVKWICETSEFLPTGSPLKTLSIFVLSANEDPCLLKLVEYDLLLKNCYRVSNNNLMVWRLFIFLCFCRRPFSFPDTVCCCTIRFASSP